MFFHFLDEFMSFVCFLSSVDCKYFICGDFNIHVDVPCTDSDKLKALLESCNLRQSVNKTTHLHCHILNLILSPSDQDMCVHVDICEFISDHAVIKCAIAVCGDFNIHVDVPCTDSDKLKALLESCNLRQSVNKTTHLHCHILNLILSPSDQDMCVHVDICEFISDHAVIKCAIASSPATCQTRISYRRFHRINMSDFRSDLKKMPFVKCQANSVSQLYDQYVHDLNCVLDRHAPLVSSLKMKQRAD